MLIPSICFLMQVMHGEDYICLGFLFGEKSRVAYISDISRFPESTEYGKYFLFILLLMLHFYAYCLRSICQFLLDMLIKAWFFVSNFKNWGWTVGSSYLGGFAQGELQNYVCCCAPLNNSIEQKL